MLLAVPVGAVGGLGAVGVELVVSVLRHLTGGDEVDLVGGAGVRRAVVLVVGAGLAALLLVRTGSQPDERGVPLVMEAESAAPGRLAGLSALWRPVAAALAIGTGSSAGREGPSVLLGAAVGDRVGRWADLDEVGERRLLAVGAAAAIAGVIHLPVTAALFVAEVFLVRRDLRSLLAIALGSASGWAVWSLVGGEPHLSVDGGQVATQGVLIAAVVVGAAAAAASIALTYGIIGADRIRARSSVSPWLLMVLGAAVVAGLGLVVGPATGSGNEVTGLLLGGGTAATGALAAIVGAKVVATSATLGSGMPGGALTSALLVGAGSGVLVASLTGGGGPAEVRAYAVLGAAAGLAALARAPVTAAALAVEVTGGLAVVPPAVIAIAVALLVVGLTGATRLYDAATG